MVYDEPCSWFMLKILKTSSNKPTCILSIHVQFLIEIETSGTLGPDALSLLTDIRWHQQHHT